jgi:hydrogenase 3 maturation protease
MGVDQQLWETLARRRRSNVVVLGVGNTLRGDDAAGPAVCERLSGRVWPRVIDAGATPENYIGSVLEAAPDILLIVDAADFGGCPGEIRLCTPDQIRTPAFCTHALSLNLAIDLIRHERTLEVYLIGIQADGMRLGDGLSPAASGAVETLVSALLEIFGTAR